MRALKRSRLNAQMFAALPEEFLRPIVRGRPRLFDAKASHAALANNAVQ